MRFLDLSLADCVREKLTKADAIKPLSNSARPKAQADGTKPTVDLAIPTSAIRTISPSTASTG